jgi:hypothetical protein
MENNRAVKAMKNGSRMYNLKYLELGSGSTTVVWDYKLTLVLHQFPILGYTFVGKKHAFVIKYHHPIVSAVCVCLCQP